MLIKVFARGVGSGYGPVKYVCDIMPFNKIPKRTPAPKVLKGNPDNMIQLIDIVPFKHKYTSGVISFAKEDMPSDFQLDEVMSDFEELAFAGLQMSSRSILWVQHEHVGRSELHYIIPRQEIH